MPASEFDSCERRVQICDDSVGHAKTMHDILDELNCLGCAVLDEWFVFDPFGELVNGHKNVLETALSSLKRSYLVQPPAQERPSGWDANKIMC